MELLQQPPKTQTNIVIQEINTQFIAETNYVENKHGNLKIWHGLFLPHAMSLSFKYLYSVRKSFGS